MCLMVLVTHLTDISHAGYWGSFHNFLNLRFCFRKRCKSDISSFWSDGVTWRQPVCLGYKGCKFAGRFMGFLPQSIWSLVETAPKARFWNRSQCVNFATGSEYSLMLTSPSTWKIVLSPGHFVAITSASGTDLEPNIKHVTIRRRKMSVTLWRWDLEFINIEQSSQFLVQRVSNRLHEDECPPIRTSINTHHLSACQ